MATWLPICHVKQRGNRFDRTKSRSNFNRLGLPKINSYNRNCNPNRKICMTITHLWQKQFAIFFEHFNSMNRF
jgi:hypothetical protein